MNNITKTAADDIVTIVDVNFTEYRRKNDLRTIRRNVTLPSWLNFEAEIIQHEMISACLFLYYTSYFCAS
ncbi:MAG: hypothetical protein LIO37_04950 [Clostridiales bacterium]|nr:hypothetical protein [Clostridiales bacterium]